MITAKRFNSLNEDQKDQCTRSARSLILWTKKISDRVSSWSSNAQGNHLCHNAFDSNSSLLGLLDKTKLRSLSILSKGGVDKPLVPLYASVWNEAMDIDFNSFETHSDELAITLLMLRIQDSALLGIKKIENTCGIEDENDLACRGLI